MEQQTKICVLISAVILSSITIIIVEGRAQEFQVFQLQEGLPNRLFRIPASALNELVRQPAQFFQRFDRQLFVPQGQEQQNPVPQVQRSFQPQPQVLSQPQQPFQQQQQQQFQTFAQQIPQPQIESVQPVQSFQEQVQLQQQPDPVPQFQSRPPAPPSVPVQHTFQQQQEPQPQQQEPQPQQQQQQLQPQPQVVQEDRSQTENLIQNRPVRQQPMTEVCLACICQASTSCNLTTQCVAGGQYCGPFLISKPYWLDAGQPVLLGDQSTRSGAFEDCASDPVCSAETVRSYMTKYMKDCNNDGRIDCDDLGRIHLMGSFGCADPSVTNTPFYQRFQQCVSKASQLSSV